jgi:hypothetical protein
MGVVRAIERLIEPLAIRFGGDHLTREPLEHLEAEEFTIEAAERSKFGIVELVRARKP